MSSHSSVGAYGWVADLRPRGPSEPVDLPGGGTAERQPGNGGFVHAPSMAHAAAGAILRNAYLSHQHEADAERGRYAVDLDSRRVRDSRQVLDAVRQGQALGAVLGYRLERGLHDAALHRLVAPLRAAYPQLVSKARDTDPETDTTTEVIPLAVLDGLSLCTAARAARDAGAASPLENLEVAPPMTSAERATADELLAQLDAAADAVADLLVAESVYQQARGNLAATTATLDALAAGQRPPEPEFAQTPRGGTPLTQRVVWLSADETVHPLWVSAGPSARAQAAPLLDRWVGELVGDPSRVLCWVTGEFGRRTVRLADLQLRPLDVLELVRASQERPAELERRALDAAFDNAPPDNAAVEYAPADADDFDPLLNRTVTELVAACQPILRLLGEARPLLAGDLASLDGAEHVPDPELADAEMTSAIGALTGLEDAHVALEAALASEEAAPIRAALRGAAAFQTEAYPGRTGDPIAAATARAVLNELRSRSLRARSVLSALEPSPTAAVRIQAATDVLRAVFGASFVRLARTRMEGDLRAHLGDIEVRSSALLAGNDDAPSMVMQQVARIRPAMATWRSLWRHASATLREQGGVRRRPRLAVHVAQLPYDEAEGWVGAPFSAERAPSGSRLSLLIHRSVGDPTPVEGSAFGGLVIDEWTELLPNTEEQTGLALHVDSPGAEAGNAVLIAVPPVRTDKFWTFDQLLATVRETFELAQIRALEPEQLGDWGQALPAMYLTTSSDQQPLTGSDQDIANAAGDVTTVLKPHLRARFTIRRRQP